jgi:glycerophosphoryl diester phosphodiesterase
MKPEVSVTIVTGGTDITEKLIIAHRGAPSYAKENTIESFEKAMALGADMVEFDVRRTKDNIFIAYHDEFIQGKPVNALTYGEIREIARDQGFDLPTVERVLKRARGRIKLDVELKEEGYEKEIVELLFKYFEKDQLIITSFNDSSLKTIKDNYLDIKVGLLLGKWRTSLLARISDFFPMRRCRKAKANLLVAHWKLLRAGFLERARRGHEPVIVWTVNDEEMIRRLLQDKRVYGIVTDRPELAVSLRKKILTMSREAPPIP